MPIRMNYKYSTFDDEIEVDVYHFQMLEEGDVAALIWNPNSECWMTVPVFTLTPIKEKTPLVE